MAEQFCESCPHNTTCGAYKSDVNLSDYEILKREEKMCNEIWDSKPCKMHANGEVYMDLDHYHMCDFEILNFQCCKNRKTLEKLVEKKCKEYLASMGQERDECMCCCDTCIHDRYLTVSAETEGLILNIATLGIDNRIKELEDGKNA